MLWAGLTPAVSVDLTAAISTSLFSSSRNDNACVRHTITGTVALRRKASRGKHSHSTPFSHTTTSPPSSPPPPPPPLAASIPVSQLYSRARGVGATGCSVRYLSAHLAAHGQVERHSARCGVTCVPSLNYAEPCRGCVLVCDTQDLTALAQVQLLQQPPGANYPPSGSTWMTHCRCQSLTWRRGGCTLIEYPG